MSFGERFEFRGEFATVNESIFELGIAIRFDLGLLAFEVEYAG